MKESEEGRGVGIRKGGRKERWDKGREEGTEEGSKDRCDTGGEEGTEEERKER